MMSVPPSIQVELFGIARLAAGARAVVVPWQGGLTLADLPARLAAACPALWGPVVVPGGRLAEGFIFNLGGRDFLRDPATPLAAGARVLLLGADAGG